MEILLKILNEGQKEKELKITENQAHRNTNTPTQRKNLKEQRGEEET